VKLVSLRSLELNDNVLATSLVKRHLYEWSTDYLITTNQNGLA
jgi:hypothetical protein